MDERSVLDLIEAGGSRYADVRDEIQPGDLLALHHDFVATWYGVQIEAVQRFTGPFAHIATFDRLRFADGRERVVVYESVVPHVRNVLVSATAEKGFFWLPLGKPMTADERESWWTEFGASPYLYDKWGAVEAGADKLPATEDADPRRWCAKSVAIRRRQSGVELAPPRRPGDPGRYVPTDMVLEAMNTCAAPLRYVRME